MKQRDMIDLKFNELAKRIFEELKQTHCSDSFFHAIDDILREPIGQADKHHRASRTSINAYNINNNNNTKFKRKKELDELATKHHQTKHSNQTQQANNNNNNNSNRLQRFNPIVRSSTIGNADFNGRSCNYTNRLTKANENSRFVQNNNNNNNKSRDVNKTTCTPGPKQTAPTLIESKSDTFDDLSPVKEFTSTPRPKESSIANATATTNLQHHMTSSSPKTSRQQLEDQILKSLYKPHMNYSTNVLGNHRLSDDDEIIIIPTKSPSLISSSPDRDSSNADEQLHESERFSISRTKNFWEKLSNNMNGPSDRPTKSLTTTFSHVGNFKNSLQGTSADCESFGKSRTFNGSAGVVRSKTINCHDYNRKNRDHIDSNGGSWTSSGDENNPSLHSTSRPDSSSLVGQLLQLSRQNKFRQTR